MQHRRHRDVVAWQARAVNACGVVGGWCQYALDSVPMAALLEAFLRHRKRPATRYTVGMIRLDNKQPRALLPTGDPPPSAAIDRVVSDSASNAGADGFGAERVAPRGGVVAKAKLVAHTLMNGANAQGDNARASVDAVEDFLNEVSHSRFGRVLQGVGLPVADAQTFTARMVEVLGIGRQQEHLLGYENAGIAVHNARAFAAEPTLAAAFEHLLTLISADDDAFRKEVAASRVARGVLYVQSADDAFVNPGGEGGRDYAFGDPTVSSLLARGLLSQHPCEHLIAAARAALPHQDKNDANAVLGLCGKLLLLLHDDANATQQEVPVGAEEILRTPAGVSLLFSDWLEPIDERPAAQAMRDTIVARVTAVHTGPLQSGFFRHGRYHLNAATAVYINCAADLGFAFRTLCPTLQARMAAEYKAISHAPHTWQSFTRSQVHLALKEALPGVYGKARRATLTHAHVVGEANPFTAISRSDALRTKVRETAPAATDADIEHDVVHEQAMLFHTVSTVELHRAGKRAALRLQARIERAIDEHPVTGASAC